ncbi:MAG: TIGR01777 family oxidoreductase [Phycisphaerales bacterium]
MSIRRFKRSVHLPVTAAEAFAWHERPGAFDRLEPPWAPVEVVEKRGGITDGSRVELSVPFGPARLRWRLEHRDYKAGEQFRDVQLSGPFKSWVHTHRFKENGQGSELTDDIEFAVPLGAVGNALAGGRIARDLDALFVYRHHITRHDLRVATRFRDEPRRTVAITGASGLIGSALARWLEFEGHSVYRLVRHPARGAQEIEWNAETGVLAPDRLASVDTVVHLAGENIAHGRWSERKKRAIHESRVRGTAMLARSMTAALTPPSALVSASAIGWYGDRGDEALDESSSAGTGFLAGVCLDWEAAAAPARDSGLRVVHPRIGAVVTPRGGMLAKLLTPFKVGLGGPVGSGNQWVSWVSLDDCVMALYEAIMNNGLEGPMNVTAPNPVSNRDLARSLGRVLHRPAIAPLPAAAARAAFGEMADEILLASGKVLPTRLDSAGFEFRDPDLEPYLARVLGRAESEAA